jgi:NADH-quinone oxidoreductase subunit G
VQIAARAAFPPGEAREDWAIIRALSEALGQTLGYDSLAALRKAIYAAVPHLARIDHVEAADAGAIGALAQRGGEVGKSPFACPIKDYYLTNPIARASAVMAECSRLASGQMLTAAE